VRSHDEPSFGRMTCVPAALRASGLPGGGFAVE